MIHLNIFLFFFFNNNVCFYTFDGKGKAKPFCHCLIFLQNEWKIYNFMVNHNKLNKLGSIDKFFNIIFLIAIHCWTIVCWRCCQCNNNDWHDRCHKWLKMKEKMEGEREWKKRKIFHLKLINDERSLLIVCHNKI